MTEPRNSQARDYFRKTGSALQVGVGVAVGIAAYNVLASVSNDLIVPSIVKLAYAGNDRRALSEWRHKMRKRGFNRADIKRYEKVAEAAMRADPDAGVDTWGEVGQSSVRDGVNVGTVGNIDIDELPAIQNALNKFNSGNFDSISGNPAAGFGFAGGLNASADATASASGDTTGDGNGNGNGNGGGSGQASGQASGPARVSARNRRIRSANIMLKELEITPRLRDAPFPPVGRKHWGIDDQFIDWSNEPGAARTSLFTSNVTGGMSLNWGSFLKWTLALIIITSFAFVLTNVILDVKTAYSFRLNDSATRLRAQDTLENSEGLFRDAPPLVMVRGLEYKLAFRTPGHPVFLSTVSSSNPGGVAGALAAQLTKPKASGSLSFIPTMDTPDTIFYESSVAVGFGNIVNVFDSKEDAGISAA